MEGGAEQSSLVLCVRFWDGRGRVQRDVKRHVAMQAAVVGRWGSSSLLAGWHVGVGLGVHV